MRSQRITDARNYSLRTYPLSTARVLSVFGELLQKARLRAGITQEELAAKVRLTREYISLLEHGKRTPTIHVFIRLARALGVSPSKLIDQVEKSTIRKT